MDKKHAIKTLLGRWATAEDLRKEYPELSDILLQGEFDGAKVNDFEFPPTGIVVSRPLIQGKEKDPTVGVIYPERYNFDIGVNTEQMFVLDGELTAGVNGGLTSKLRTYGSIIAPHGTTLNLSTSGIVFYVCTYTPHKPTR